MNNTALAFIDFETTGLDFENHLPIQVGMIVAAPEEDGTLREIHRGYVEKIQVPSLHPMSKKAHEVHGLTIDDLHKNGVTREEACDILFGDISPSSYTLAGWNVKFDYYFLKKLCELGDMKGRFSKISHRVLDLQSVFQWLVRTGKIEGSLDMGMDSVLELLDIEGRQMKYHDALEDAELSKKVYEALFEYTID